ERALSHRPELAREPLAVQRAMAAIHAARHSEARQITIQCPGAAAALEAPMPKAQRLGPAFPGPRERLAYSGTECLSEAELLALLLGTGSRDESVTVLAARLLLAGGGLAGLGRMGRGELLAL